MSLLLPTLLALLNAVTPITSQDRRSRDEPEMMVNAGGRTGICDVLAFDASHKWLFAAGDDKVIRAWQIGEQGLTDRTKTYRWPGWREQRGGIKTLSLASDARILVGGFGMKIGLVMLLDKDGEVAGTNNVAGSLPEMPRTAIFSSAFTPSEKAAVFGDSEGNIWWWDLQGPATLLTKFPPIPGREFNRVLAMRFTGKTKLTAVAESGDVMLIDNPESATPAASIVYNAKAALPADVPATRDTRLARAEITADGQWVVGLMVQRYAVVCSTEGKSLLHLDAGEGRFYRSAAADPAHHRLALAVAVNPKPGEFLVPRDLGVQILADAFGGPGRVAATLPHTVDAEVMTFHPGDGRLIVAGGDNHELGVWDLADIKKPERLRGILGHGRSVWGVRIAKSGTSFAWQSQRNNETTDINALGKGSWHTFDMNLGKPAVATPLNEIITEAGGWKIVPSKKSRFIWLAVRTVGNEQKELELALDPDRDQSPQCYCFFPEKAGQPVRVAIGHLYGFSVFELGETKAERVLLATGHAGEVRSIAISQDGTWAVTGGRDQTVSGWSLKPWPSGRFGAELIVRGGDLVVSKIDLGGPAWEMGLRENDTIKMAVRFANNRPTFLLDRLGRHLSMKLNPDQLINSPEETIKTLNNPMPGIEHTLAWQRPGEKQIRQGLSTVRHRPLWRFFPAYDANNNWTEWVAWTWRGSKYVTSPSGDWLVGFQLNDPFSIVGGRPRYYEANLFRQTLHQPRAVLKLMQQRDVAKMLVDEYGENPMPPAIGDRQPMPISLKLSDEKVSHDGIKATVSIEMFSSNPDLMPQNVELWVNDHRVKTLDWPQDKRIHTTEIEIPAADFRSGENQITVVSVNEAGGRAIERTTVMNDRKPNRPNIAGLLTGINDYKGTRLAAGARGEEFGDLLYAKDDANQLRESWLIQAGEGRYYGRQGVIVLSETEATRKEILSQLAQLKTRTTSDDVAVIFFAGHGHWIDRPDATGKNRRKPPKMFIFCCRGFDVNKPLETGITDEELILALAECPARKLLLLDACHSGQAATDSVIRHLIPDGQGPAIIAACDQQESSLEHDKFGHGLFTAAVIEALTKNFDLADTGKTKDNRLDPQELYDYLGARIRNMLVEINTVPTRQQPRSFPLDLPRFVIAQGDKK